MKLLETMQASQAADAKAFQELMEKKIATMTALRGMQQNDAKSLAQLESLIRQTRQAMAPVAPEPIKAPAPIKVQEAPKATEENTTSAKQVESLTRLINDLDREVKQISHKVDQIQK